MYRFMQFLMSLCICALAIGCSDGLDVTEPSSRQQEHSDVAVATHSASSSSEISQGNLLENPAADQLLDDWSFYGTSGVFMTAHDGNEFTMEELDGQSSHVFQDVTLPDGSEGKFILLAGRGWVARVVPGSITRHPYLYGYQMTTEGQILRYMQGQDLRHTAGAREWQYLNGVFQVEPGVTQVRFFMMQASQVGDAPDGTRAAFDDLELLLFESENEARNYVADRLFVPKKEQAM